MNKSELIEAIAAELGESKEAARKAVDMVFASITTQVGSEKKDMPNETNTENDREVFRTARSVFARFVNGLAGPALVLRDMQTHVKDQYYAHNRGNETESLANLAMHLFEKRKGGGSVQLENLESRLSEHVGARVCLCPNPKLSGSGIIAIEFTDIDAFEQIMKRCGFEEDEGEMDVESASVVSKTEQVDIESVAEPYTEVRSVHKSKKKSKRK